MTPFDTSLFWQEETRAHLEVAAASFETLEPAFQALLDSCIKSVTQGGKIMFFGNGGSAADAQHLATELSIRYAQDRPPIAALALTTDTSALTAAGNDLGFDAIFARQVEALAMPHDIAIGISTSGNSENVCRGLAMARTMNIATAGLSAGTGGRMAPLCDVLLAVPAQNTARIQEMHITLGHMLCAALERALGLVGS